MKNVGLIPGIYNYCDRWCEKCTHTSKCLNYKKLKDIGVLDDIDTGNQKFWEILGEVFSETKELLSRSANEQGIDLSEISVDTKEEERKDELVKNHKLVKLAEQYADLVDEFFKRYEAYILDSIMVMMDVRKTEHVKDSIEIIRWYQHFILVKLMSSVHFDPDDSIEYDEMSEFNYSLGSGKVALVSVERSMGALTLLFNEFPKIMDEIITLLSHLEKLKNCIEKFFPKVRDFVRPGLDTQVDSGESYNC